MQHGQLDAPWHYAMADYARAGAPYGYGGGALKRWWKERERGRVRCVACGSTILVAGDDLAEARLELYDEGWAETQPWDGDDATALAHWRCCDEGAETE